MTELRTYGELVKLPTFLERFRYLSLAGRVAEQTFGPERWINQRFYNSREWKQIKSYVIARDEGNDLGVEGYLVQHRIIVHHMNPMVPMDIIHGTRGILDPDYLITTTHKTHNAIHYGDEQQLPRVFVERQPGDTVLWNR